MHIELNPSVLINSMNSLFVVDEKEPKIESLTIELEPRAMSIRTWCFQTIFPSFDQF